MVVVFRYVGDNFPSKREALWAEIFNFSMPRRLFCGFCWGISMLFDHSMISAVALHHGRGGKMTSIIV
jgi:hypothetical protein